MAGIEIAGIALAVFPIVVHSIGTYAEGIETIKKLRRQRRELESYARVLKTQKVYYLDTLEELLDGIVDLEALSGMLQDSDSTAWRASDYEQRLRDRLGRSYHPFVESCSQLCESLKILEKKLRSNGDASKIDLEDRLRQLKVVLSRTLYDEHVENIRNANRELRDIVHQSLKLEDTRKRRRLPRAVSAHYAGARKHARSLHKVLLGKNCWKCGSSCRHVANIRLECRESQQNSNPKSFEAGGSDTLRFNILLALSKSQAPPGLSSDSWHWKELSIEPVPSVDPSQALQINALIPSLPTKVSDATQRDRLQLLGQPSKEKGKKAASFALPTEGMSTTISATLGSFQAGPQQVSVPPLAISDLCSALRDNVQTICPPAHHCIGMILDDTQQTLRHQLFLLNKPPKVTETCTLKSLLQFSQPIRLTRGDRLRIACRLASSVMQFEGSWLKETWRSQDIFFMKDDLELHNPLGRETPHPYLSWSISKDNLSNLPNLISTLAIDNTQHLIRSKPLFYLGLALIELSFGKTLEELRPLSPFNPLTTTNSSLEAFQTAVSLINSVYAESGIRYGDVVRRCIQCPYDVRDASLDNDEFQQAVLETVVMPLMEDLKDFEGASRIR